MILARSAEVLLPPAEASQANVLTELLQQVDLRAPDLDIQLDVVELELVDQHRVLQQQRRLLGDLSATQQDTLSVLLRRLVAPFEAQA